MVGTGREQWRWKGSQQSLYRFEDRLQSSIVTILRNPNNLSLASEPQTSSQPLGQKFTVVDFYAIALTDYIEPLEIIGFFITLERTWLFNIKIFIFLRSIFFIHIKCVINLILKLRYLSVSGKKILKYIHVYVCL